VVLALGELELWDGNACPSGNGSESSARRTDSGFVVVVRRGGCSFSDKVVTILAAVAAVAVVIVDHDGSELMAPGLGDTRGIRIPVVMVPFHVGSELFPASFTGVGAIDTRAGVGAIDTRASAVPSFAGSRFGSVALVSATLNELRGRGACQCSVESPGPMAEWHVMHREGLKERLDFVVDEGKRALMCFSAVRTIKALRHFAPSIPPYATVGDSHNDNDARYLHSPVSRRCYETPA